MNTIATFTAFSLSLLAALPLLRTTISRSERRMRLDYLEERDRREDAEPEAIDWRRSAEALKQFGDRFGRAGFVTVEARRNGRIIAALFIAGTACFSLFVAVVADFSAAGVFASAFGGAYAGLTAFAFFLRFRERDYERELLFQMPIFLESLVLLVESGLGILPALERVVNCNGGRNDHNPVSRLFQFVYQLSARGMPFSQALETVADASPQRVVRHVMLHLDISGNEGGELIPSLRSLSDHSHTEWRLSVEQRVRRLENLVVFPVFCSVIGLMILTAAVPIVPLLDLKDLLDKTPSLRASTIPGGRP